MRTGFVVWAAAGLLLALGVIAGASALGPAALHISLTHGAVSAAGSGLSYPTSNQAPSKDLSVPGSGAAPSSLTALTGASGTSVGLLLLPVVIGVAVGGLFYGIFARRTGSG